MKAWEEDTRRAGRSGAHEKNGHHSSREPQPDIAIPEPPPWPSPPGEAAYHGLAGEIVHAVEEQTEADPVAILIQILVMFGSAVGRGGYWCVDETKHFANLFCCLVGPTSLGRKGTSKARAIRAFDSLEDGWHKRIVSGLSSGEGLISAVKDPTYKTHQIKNRGRVVDTQQVLDDPGESDKRLLVIEPEFGRALRAMQRDGNTLSPILRSAWDGDDLSSLTKGPANSRLRASAPHIALITHVTPTELRRLYSDVEAASGSGNRVLWVASKRSKLLPLGGYPVNIGSLKTDMAAVAREGRQHREIPFDDEAADFWAQGEYERLNVTTPGLLGSVTDRATAQVRRLTIIYAMLDGHLKANIAHLRAALAVWEYCFRSAQWVFGDSTGDSVADEILCSLRSAKLLGMTQTEIRDLFHRNQSGMRIGQALATLQAAGLARSEEVETGGRPTKRWFLVTT